MPQILDPRAQKVQDALAEQGIACVVVELPASTRTAREAAQAIGCRVDQIVKSIVFRGKISGNPFLVAASGSNRVDEAKLSELVGEPVEKADAEFVRVNTGYAIGGVPPVAHARAVPAFIDADLFQYDVIWAAAGTPHAVFKLTATQLERITGGRVIRIQ